MSILTTPNLERRPSNLLVRSGSRFMTRVSLQRQSSRLIQNMQLNKLELSVQVIKFTYACSAQTKIITNKQLVLTNRTGGRIGFKIKCNNPQNYEVQPTKRNMEDGEKVQIRIKITLQGTTNLNKYKNDQFQIEWGKVNQYSNTVPEYSEHTQLKVELSAQKQQIKFESIRVQIEESERECLMYMRARQKNNRKIEELDLEIERLKKQPKPISISLLMATLLACFFFALAFLIF